MNNKPDIRIYQTKASPLSVIVVLFLIIVGISLFFFFGFIALIISGLLALGASLLRLFIPKKKRLFKEYDTRTRTITLEKKDYEIIDHDK